MLDDGFTYEEVVGLVEEAENFSDEIFMIASKFVECVDHDAVAERVNGKRAVRLLHTSFGLCTEAGEFQDALKKHFFYGKPLDETNLVEELGDVLWYVAIACDQLGVSITEVMKKNSNKLLHRYKGGFSESQAQSRDLEKEREILES